MPWTDKPGSSGGPGGPKKTNGNGTGGTGPWGQPSNDGPRKPEGRKPQPAPDLEELLRSGRERFRGKGGGGRGGGPRSGEPFKAPSGKVIGIAAAAIGALWLASGFYQIEPGARGVVTTFGDFAALTDSGLNWHAPWPFQDVEKVDVQEDRAVTIGRGREKVSMLTSDLNIVDVDLQVNYRIKDDADTAPGELPNAAKYVFNIEGPEQLVRATAEAALREVVGGEDFGAIISRGRSIVNERTAEILQETLTSYDSGIQVIRVNFGQADPPEQVIASQRDVVDARSEAEQRVNVATGYANQQVPVAQGQARQTVLDAEGYAARVTAEARGQAARFNDIYAEYAKAPQVTRQRMYLETMEDVLAQSNKIIMDEDGSSTVPLLDVNEIAGAASRRRGERAASDANTGSN